MARSTPTWLQRRAATWTAGATTHQLQLYAVLTMVAILAVDMTTRDLALRFLPDAGPGKTLMLIPHVLGIGLTVGSSEAFFGHQVGPWFATVRYTVSVAIGLWLTWSQIGTTARATKALSLASTNPRMFIGLVVMAGAVVANGFSFFMFGGNVLFAHQPISSFAFADCMMVGGAVMGLVPERVVVPVAATVGDISAARI